MNFVSEGGVPAGTISAALRWASGRLQASRVESPRLAAEVLLGHVLGWERSRLLAHGQDRVAEGVWDEFRALVRQCASGVPLQYLTGNREFFGLSFQVTPDVLIPRPETEILVERALELARELSGPVRFVDVGTGSGCIAVAFAGNHPDALGYATDLSQAALAVAKTNAARLGVADRVLCARCDLLECFPPRPLFDLVLSNPPYVPVTQRESLPRNVRDHEPALALFAGDTGLDVYARLVPQAAARLTSRGCFLVEIGIGQSEAVSGIVSSQGLRVVEILEDLQHIPRCLIARP